ncbi:MAG: TerB N-terminal domain-containing protein [Victivallales bacterium]|nr:TerB N-terminal domain-containing protein [Victivallales bacterium]
MKVHSRGVGVELAELATYAEERYHIREERKWADFPGFSVLREPVTGKWLALLMRQWDSETGMMIERCDIKCGPPDASQMTIPYLSRPFRMQWTKWVGVRFGRETDAAVVYSLFDRALLLEKQLFTAAQSRGVAQGGATYRDTAVPTGIPRGKVENHALPAMLRDMRRMDNLLGSKDIQKRYELFCRQAKFMENYEDNAPWEGDFFHFFPTYHDLNISQLRGYFTWRTWVRRGEYRRTSTSFAFLYIYELLNGFGVPSPEETLRKLQEFKAGYLDSGIGDRRKMEGYLTRWMLEYSVVKNFPLEVTIQFVPSEMLETDKALMALQDPEGHTDGEVFAALSFFSKRKIDLSPVVTRHGERGRTLFAKAWRCAIARSRQKEGTDIFTICFGVQMVCQWMPLYNAFCFSVMDSADRDYPLNDIHRFQCRGGNWQEVKYPGLLHDATRLGEYLHETDRMLRKYLKTGHALRKRKEEEWAMPFAEAFIESEKRAAQEASRPKITLDLSGLEQIRKEALLTQNSLLTEDETQAAPPLPMTWDAEDEPVKGPPDIPPAATMAHPLVTGENTADSSSLHLDGFHAQVLRILLQGQSPAELIKSHRLMPSLVADAVNETLFDEIGDNVLDIDNDVLSLVEDYREDVARLLGDE